MIGVELMPFEIFNRRYTGSKAKITEWIRDIILRNCKDCHSFADIFAGTGVVTNSLINDFNSFFINDFLYSNEVIYNAFFGKGNFSFEKIMKYCQKYKDLDATEIKPNYVSLNYGDKFFEKNDALKIGFIREDLERNKPYLNKREFDILLASLIYSFDRSANTVGHYEAYFKNIKNLRSSFVFELINPVILGKKDNRNITITREDANLLGKTLKADIVYIDPPYSSRQYSRFYHVIENIVEWKKPKLFGVALKPAPENMSTYCSSKAINSFMELIGELRCKYIVVSYNNTYNSRSKSSENKMTLDDIKKTLDFKGNTQVFSINHNAFNAGKTNLADHKEILFLTTIKG